MPSISKKLKSLGVKIGADNLSSTKKNLATQHHTKTDLEKLLSGRTSKTPYGEIFLVENVYQHPYKHGIETLAAPVPLDGLANWVGEKRINDLDLDSFAFIDTETTGLSGGSGTYAFLIGVGRFINKDFHLTQLVMRDPIEEPAQLSVLEGLLAQCDAVVTFNGKSFDMPLLKTRYISHRWPVPFTEYPHIDLLHLARGMWRDRLASRTLGNLEAQIIGTVRTDEDIPGWAIPQLYFDYLDTGDASLLKGVIYHNAMDIISLAALFSRMARLLSDPFAEDIEHVVDIIALGKLFERLGDNVKARRLYGIGLDHGEINSENFPESALLDGLTRLALLHKRANNYPAAIPLWEQAVRHNDLPAFIELAKYYEHKERDFSTAHKWTQTAIDSLMNSTSGGLSESIMIKRWLPELEHRKARLQRKLAQSHVLAE
jgi:uncharacterized protein YprB with RNaseH-like and TPR domain